MIEKVMAYEAVVDVNGFHDARTWIDRMIGARIVACGECDQAATHVFWVDRAEWYCRCELHREYGEQWTGSTRWGSGPLRINILRDKMRTWFDTLESFERNKIRVRKYDATDYYGLMPKDMPYTRHYLIGSAEADGYQVYVDVHPLTNGAYAYQLHRGWYHGGSGTGYGDYIRGMWETEESALEAARLDAKIPTESSGDAADIPG